MIEDKDLDSLSQQLKVGDVLELTILDADFASGQTIEIPIACKHVTKHHLFLHFHQHTLKFDLAEMDEQENDKGLEVMIDHIDIIDTEKAYLSTFDEEMSWSHQLVTWKKIASCSDYRYILSHS